MIPSQRIRIQQEIRTIVLGGTFYQVFYNAGGAPKDILDAAPSCVPDSVRCNEIESQFGEDKKNGRDYILARPSWVFEVFVEWNNKEVLLEAFEEFLSRPPIIPALSESFKQVTVVLLNTVVNHPVTGANGISTGTQAKFTVRAVLGRS